MTARNKATISTFLMSLTAMVQFFGMGLAFSSPIGTLVAAPVIALWFLANFKVFRCPNCHRSMFDWGLVYSIWPARTCSGCQTDLVGS